MRSWVPSRIRGLLSIYPYVFQSSLPYCRILSNLEQVHPSFPIGSSAPPSAARPLPCSFLLRRASTPALTWYLPCAPQMRVK
jgi:hypothetical protein